MFPSPFGVFSFQIKKEILSAEELPVSVPFRGLIFPNFYNWFFVPFLAPVSVPFRGLIFPNIMKAMHERYENVSVPFRGLIFPNYQR